MNRASPAVTVDQYLNAVPLEQREALSAVRRMLEDAIPGVEAVISYQVPIFRYRGQGLVGISAGKKHCSLHLMSPPLAASIGGELTEGKMSGATLHFDADDPLSERTVRLIVERRMAEVDARLG